ncbi:hypothetical protein [Gryllotalpicola koreensis]|uniref:Scaffolding protein n=1 Tax=Gryllotalpicola koreensis TaxID=993086 RepID=A0ABP8A1S6_9MICO
MNTAFPFARRDVDGLARIGSTPFDLRGIRFEDTDEGNTGEETVTETTAETAPVDASPEAPVSEGDKPEVFDRDYVEQLRKEAADWRTKHKTADKAANDAKNAYDSLKEQFGKAFGFIEKDTPAEDLVKAAQDERDRTQTQLHSLLRENAVTKAASTNGANVGALTDSVTFQAKVANLDPTADDFASQVEALVKQTVESDPKFKAVQVAASTGSASTTHSGEGEAAASVTRDELKKLMAQPGGHAKILQLQREGKLQHLVS